MPLKAITLAGFKSFVDLTTVVLRGSIVGIVGPNGCGKSNIFEAISWVMGESSAKYLRGEALIDVIFNGSHTRKPVGQASVELLLDNQEGSVGGEYAQCAEIAIRRLLSRDGESQYFLNGVRCRRRDVTDLFLGTGLGARNYAIIGQNTIARMVEAKPEELRAYLEEAAGISKYKERRRESENRMQHTADNLARLNDMRQELDKRLQQLHRETQAAEKFKSLQEAARQLQGECQAIEWRTLKVHENHHHLQIARQETQLTKIQSDLAALEREQDLQQAHQRQIQEDFQKKQHDYYHNQHEITRLEQAIQQDRDKQRQNALEQERLEKDYQACVTQLTVFQEEADRILQGLTELTPQEVQTKEQAESALTTWKTTQGALHTWQAEWADLTLQMAKVNEMVQIEQTHLHHLTQTLETLSSQRMQHSPEAQEAHCATLAQELHDLSAHLLAANESVSLLEKSYEALQEALKAAQAALKADTDRLQDVHRQIEHIRREQASLEGLQQTALGLRDDAVVDWLTQQDLHEKPRLAQALEVEAGWERAVETVLSGFLQAIGVTHFQNFMSTFSKTSAAEVGDVCFFATSPPAHTLLQSGRTLFSKIRSPWPLSSLLANVHVADTLEEAFTLCAGLATGESVITREGVWMSPHWLRLHSGKKPDRGILLREQSLKKLIQEMQVLTDTEQTLTHHIQTKQHHIAQLMQERETHREAHRQAHAKVAELTAKQGIQQTYWEESKKRLSEMLQENNRQTTLFETASQKLLDTQTTLDHAKQHHDQLSQRCDILAPQGTHLERSLEVAQRSKEQATEQAHALAMQRLALQSRETALVEAMARETATSHTLKERMSQVPIHETAKVEEDLQRMLDVALRDHLALQSALDATQAAVHASSHTLSELETKRREALQESHQLHAVLEATRLEEKAFAVKAEVLCDQMTEAGLDRDALLSSLAETADLAVWRDKLDRTTQNVQKLGAVNLLALDEYKTCQERKTYLDTQWDDLQASLQILNDAMVTMDRETRAQFKETFEQVNAHFEALFPRIFGGGRASLELMNHDLLDAGVRVVACPPGKRNSTIHLLSGGEKTMTAIALVFSIFALNPAPFCLLDEVDASLDDANIHRFCDLIKTVSAKTQFIFISHNKLAIEAASHLIGVTMQEAGVSRLVSVDVEEAMRLASA